MSNGKTVWNASIFSLRGKVEVIDNQITVNHLVFDYASPDRTRAWKVKEAYIWPVEPQKAIHNNNGFMLLTAALATDIGKFNKDELSDPTENRLFAWAQQNYNTREGDGSNFITPNGFPLNQARFLVDPDTVNVKELYINISNSSDYDVNFSREWGYLIILEEDKVTAAQSVFQQVKGMAQDISKV